MHNNYKSISFQLFGNFNKSSSSCTCGDDKLCWRKFDLSVKGPYVDLSGDSGKKGRCAAVGKRKRKKRVRKTAKGREWKGRPPKVSTRCLICYAELMGGEKPKEDDTGEQLDNELRELFPTFVNLLLTKTDQDPTPEASLEGGKENRLKTEVLKLSTSKQIKPYPFLCSVCSAAARQFVSGYHAMKKLEEQVSEMRAKFLNALKLSAMLAATESTKVDTESASKPVKIIIESVEYLRKCLLLGGSPPEVEECRRKRRFISKSVRADVAEVLDDIITTIEDIEGASRIQTVEERPDQRKTCNSSGSSFSRDQNEAGADVANSDDMESNMDFCPADDDDFGWDQTNYDNGDSNCLDVTLKNKERDETDEEKLPEPSPSKKSSCKRKKQSSRTRHKKGIRLPAKVPKRLSTARVKQFLEMQAKDPQLTHREFFRLVTVPKMIGPLTEEETARRERHRMRLKEYEKRFKAMYPGVTREQYKEMKLKEVAEEINLKDGLPGRSIKGERPYRVIIPVKEVVGEDGRTRYFHRDVEIIKRDEDGFFACGACSCSDRSWCKSLIIVKTHINKNHIDLSNGHECEVCGRKFYYHNQLITHLKSSHKIGDCQYQCDICGGIFASRTSRQQHKKVVHDGIKPHVCEHCGKAFGARKDMRLHARRHTGERPFVCHVCADAFYDRTTLKKHVQRIHPEAVEDITQPSNSNQGRRIHRMANMKLDTAGMDEVEDEQDIASAAVDPLEGF